MRVSDFDFHLPPDRIAQAPVEPRDSARLLCVGETLADRRVRDLPGILPDGALLVLNDTRVIPSRLRGRRRGAGVEVTLHKPASDDGGWWAFARPARKLAAGDVIDFAKGFAAEVRARKEGGEVLLAFGLPPDDLMARLHRHGQMPLPPYIKRPKGGDARDRVDYQTVFAARDGAVAAPTAGLHFTDTLVAALESRGIESVLVTLHVGAGTFLPVKAERTEDHVMHAERGEITPATADRLNRAKAAGRTVVPVGTTALRLIETAAEEQGRVAPFTGETDIFMTPGYDFRVADKLMTNFHLPRSTLFMLVAAFSGLERMKRAYAHAIGAGYRFYSYGDACLLDRMTDQAP